LHMVHLMLLPPHHLLLQRNSEWCTFLVPVYPGCLGNRLLNGCSSSRTEARVYCEGPRGQIPLVYPASEPSCELVCTLVCDLLQSWLQTCSELEFGLSRTVTSIELERARRSAARSQTICKPVCNQVRATWSQTGSQLVCDQVTSMSQNSSRTGLRAGSLAG